MRILVISAEPSLRETLLGRLTDAGHSVEQAGDPALARARLARGDVDAVLCDLELPGTDGLALLRESRRAGIDAAFVIVAGSGSVDTTVEALRAGASDYVTRPVSGDEVLHRLEQIAALRRLREENEALRRVADVAAPNGVNGSNGANGVNGSNGLHVTLRMQLRRHEGEIIVRALEDSDGDRRVAAQRLGIGLSSLYRKIDDLELRDRVRASP